MCPPSPSKPRSLRERPGSEIYYQGDTPEATHVANYRARRYGLDSRKANYPVNYFGAYSDWVDGWVPNNWKGRLTNANIKVTLTPCGARGPGDRDAT